MTPLRSLPLLASLLLPPLAGAWLADRPLAPHLHFPWRSLEAGADGFSPAAFTALVLLLLPLSLGLALWLHRHLSLQPPARRPFPRWGWAGPVLILVAWPISWSSTPVLSAFQPWIFFPLWLGYIITVNALAWSRGGRSLLVRQPCDALVLFAGSAVFWWYFEYLNGFVHNWRYLGALPSGDFAYTVRASLAFSTVLPAVIGTRDLLATYLCLERESVHRPPPWIAGFCLLAGVLGLVLLPVFPERLYPLLWLAPLAVITGWQLAWRLPTAFDGCSLQHWDGVLCMALAGLVCGLFWELWNWQGQVKWVYSVPGLDRLHLFEMPLPGYAGYLPFGLECLAVARLLRPRSGI